VDAQGEEYQPKQRQILHGTWEENTIRDAKDMPMEMGEEFAPVYDESEFSRSCHGGYGLFLSDEVVGNQFPMAFSDHSGNSGNSANSATQSDGSPEFFSPGEFSQRNTVGGGYDPTIALTMMEEMVSGTSNDGWQVSERSARKHNSGSSYSREHELASEVSHPSFKQPGTGELQGQSQTGGDARMTIVIHDAKPETLVEVMKVLVDSRARVEFRCG
jgi:hypothetical protein